MRSDARAVPPDRRLRGLAGVLSVVAVLHAAACGAPQPAPLTDATAFAVVAEYFKNDHQLNVLRIDPRPYIFQNDRRELDSALIASAADSLTRSRRETLRSRGITEYDGSTTQPCTPTGADATSAESECGASASMSIPFRWAPFGKSEFATWKAYRGVYGVVARASGVVEFNDGGPFHVNILLRFEEGEWRVWDVRCC